MPSRNPDVVGRVAALVLLTFSAAGCVDYLNRYEGVTLAAGDAMYANAAIQTIDPWPASSRKTTIPYVGRKTILGTRAYTSRPVEPSPTTIININN